MSPVFTITTSTHNRQVHLGSHPRYLSSAQFLQGWSLFSKTDLRSQFDTSDRSGFKLQIHPGYLYRTWIPVPYLDTCTARARANYTQHLYNELSHFLYAGAGAGIRSPVWNGLTKFSPALCA